MGLFGPPNISQLKAKRNLKGLRKALRYKDWKIRKEAASVFCEWNEPEGVAFLKGNLSNPESTIALEAAACLADFGDKSGLQVLIHSLKQNPSVGVAEKLGKLKDSEATDALLEELKYWTQAHQFDHGVDWTLPRALAKAIVTIEGIRILPRALKIELLLYELIQGQNDVLIQETVRVLEGLEQEARNQIAVSLGYIASGAIAPLLFRSGFSIAVAEKLLRDREVQEVFKRHYANVDPSAREGIIKIIALTPTEENLKFLCDCIYDPEAYVAGKAIDAIIGSESQFKEKDKIVGRLTDIFREPAVPMATKLHLAEAMRGKWAPATDTEKAYSAFADKNVTSAELGPLAAPVFVNGLMHPPCSLQCLKALEVMLRTFPGEITEEDLRKITMVDSIRSETPEVQSDGADGLYWGTDRKTYSADSIQKLAMKELRRRGLSIQGEKL
jgi:hypothetical protein